MNYFEIIKFSNIFYSLAQGRHPLAGMSYDIVDAIGGLVNAEYLREGMRDISKIRKIFENKNAIEAETIATNLSEPIKVSIKQFPNNTYKIYVIDGRHRATAAREAGAELIKATVYYTIYQDVKNDIYEDLEPFNTVLPLGKNIEKLIQKNDEFFLERDEEEKITSF